MLLPVRVHQDGTVGDVAEWIMKQHHHQGQKKKKKRKAGDGAVALRMEGFVLPSTEVSSVPVAHHHDDHDDWII